MNCPTCGRQNPAEAAFCSGCGVSLGDRQRTPDSTAYCITCGAANSADARHCVGCGAAMEAAGTPERRVAYCPSCGARNWASDSVCVECRSALRGAAGRAAPPRDPLANAEYVGFWPRLLVQIIDGVIFMVAAVIFTIIRVCLIDRWACWLTPVWERCASTELGPSSFTGRLSVPRKVVYLC